MGNDILEEKKFNELEKHEIQVLIEKHGVIQRCSCGGISVPSTVTISMDIEEDEEKEKNVTIHNFPVMKCTQLICGEWSYSAIDYLETLKKAKEEYANNDEY